VATVEVRRIMAGDPHKPYELIADVTRMGEWSPQRLMRTRLPVSSRALWACRGGRSTVG
jgi:hypothetical protein